MLIAAWVLRPTTELPRAPDYSRVAADTAAVLVAPDGRRSCLTDRDTVTARTLLGSQTLRWEDIAGLRFGRNLWAVARRHDGSEVMLPAVTFNTLPSLTLASAGRVPNPYE